jgi:hypothetical protein
MVIIFAAASAASSQINRQAIGSQSNTTITSATPALGNPSHRKRQRPQVSQ